MNKSYQKTSSNNEQNEKTTYILGENISKAYI
jgi:hypothetical protein